MSCAFLTWQTIQEECIWEGREQRGRVCVRVCVCEREFSSFSGNGSLETTVAANIKEGNLEGNKHR